MTGSTSPNLTTAARSAMSRLLDHILDQSEFSIGADQMKTRPVPPLVQTKVKNQRAAGIWCKRVSYLCISSHQNLATALQQHFLLFSQRLHTTEVERRGLRLQVANLRRGLKQEKEKEETSRTVRPEMQSALWLVWLSSHQINSVPALLGFVQYVLYQWKWQKGISGSEWAQLVRVVSLWYCFVSLVVVLCTLEGVFCLFLIVQSLGRIF